MLYKSKEVYIKGINSKPNLAIIHGGGPTPVINSTLYGVITEALNSRKISKLYGEKRANNWVYHTYKKNMQFWYTISYSLIPHQLKQTP